MGIAGVFSTVQRNFCLRVGLALAGLFFFATLGVAQVAPAGTGGFGARKLDLFGTGSVLSSGYHGAHLWGYSLGGDYRIRHWLWIRGDYQTAIRRTLPKFKYQLYERDILFGPVAKYRIGPFTAYADALAGPTQITYPSTNFTDGELGIAAGGGVDFHLFGRLSLRAADIQWTESNIGSPPARHPILYNAGLVFRIF